VPTMAAGQQIDAFPSIVDEGKTVGIELLADEDSQYEATWAGTSRLLRLNVGGSARMLNDLWDNQAELALASSPQGSKLAWVDDAADCIFAHLLSKAGGLVWNESDWDRLANQVRVELPNAVSTYGGQAVEILKLNQDLKRDLGAAVPSKFHPAYRDMIAHLHRLVYPRHLTGVGAPRLVDIVRYLKGIRVRLDKLSGKISRDGQQMRKCQRLEADLDAYLERLDPSPQLEALNWQLEEFRIASFAQDLGTKTKVSEERIRAAMDLL